MGYRHKRDFKVNRLLLCLFFGPLCDIKQKPKDGVKNGDEEMGGQQHPVAAVEFRKGAVHDGFDRGGHEPYDRAP